MTNQPTPAQAHDITDRQLNLAWSAFKNAGPLACCNRHRLQAALQVHESTQQETLRRVKLGLERGIELGNWRMVKASLSALTEMMEG